MAMVSISWALVASLLGEPLAPFFFPRPSPPPPPPSPVSYIGLSNNTPSPADTALREKIEREEVIVLF